MSPRASLLTTSFASLALVASAGYTAAIGDWTTMLACAFCAFAVVVAWVIVRHDPTSPVGPALAWTTAVIGLVTAHVGPAADLPWSVGIWPLNLAGLLVLMLVFPDGPSEGRLWRVVPWAFAAATAGMVAAQWGGKQVDGVVMGGSEGAWVNPLALVSIFTIGMCLVLSAASLVTRYRKGAPRTKRRIRWLMLAGIAVVSLLVAGWVAEALGAALRVAYTPFLAAIVVLVPTAVGIAIVRHDLFDIDRLLSKTASWLVTLLVSAAVFGAIVYAVSRAVSVGTGLTAGVAAFVTALMLLPVQRYLASWVGRVLDRDQFVAVAEVERFTADVRAGRRQPEEVEEVLRLTVNDPALAVYIARPEGGWSTLSGIAVPEPKGLAIAAAGDLIARISLGWDSARARRRVADLAGVAWVPIEMSRLRLVLREALAETDASRRRLMVTSAEERRRLERDLHDGAQQRIVATGMRLRLLQERLPAHQAAEVDAAVNELRETVDELRRIAQGVRPSLLDDGLAAALAGVKEASPVPVELRVDDLPDVSDTRALTAYLMVNEAVANALKHAQASRICVAVSALDERLAVEITDDGIGGLAEDAPLTALRDRVLSIGGTLTVLSPRDVGTTIRAVV
ncbi:MAG: histidine kinase [Nocardioides sp.]